VDGVSIHWKVYARNKKSITLNPRSAVGRDLLLQLVEGAQILVENFLPGTLEKWDLGWDVLSARNPSLVMVRVPMHNVAAHLSATPGQIRHPAPTLGQHNGEIYEALGLSSADIAALKKDDVI
jgi:crotonobetainyl-CoA:carnitine CoA-transferase CaiB-like acyl-CoA transferase